MAVLKLALVLLERANAPLAVFLTPVVLFKSASAPVAVLLSPVLKRSVPAPMAVLKLPVVFAKSECQPAAVFPDAGGEVEQGVLSFRRVEPGIAAVWGWDNRSHQRCNSKPDKHKDD